MEQDKNTSLNQEASKKPGFFSLSTQTTGMRRIAASLVAITIFISIFFGPVLLLVTSPDLPSSGILSYLGDILLLIYVACFAGMVIYFQKKRYALVIILSLVMLALIALLFTHSSTRDIL